MEQTQEAKVELLRVAQIEEDPGQPRRPTPAGPALEGLKESIRAVGILSPVLVRPGNAGGFLLVAGSRRLRAARELKLPTVPAIIRVLTEVEAREIQLIENLQREDLTPLEEAGGYQGLADLGLTYEQIGLRLGRSKGHVGNLVRLLKLPKAVQEAIAAGKLTAHHGRALAVLVPYPALLEAVGREVIRHRPDVGQLDDNLEWWIQRSKGPARPLSSYATWGPKNPLGRCGVLFTPANAVPVKRLTPVLQKRATAAGTFYHPGPCTTCPHGYRVKGSYHEGACLDPAGTCYELRQINAATVAKARESQTERQAQGKVKSARASERVKLARRQARWEKLVAKAAGWIRRHPPKPKVLILRELVDDFESYQMRPETVRALIGPELEAAGVKLEQFKKDPAKVLGKLPERRLAQLLRLSQGIEDDRPAYGRGRSPFALPVKGIGQHWRWGR